MNRRTHTRIPLTSRSGVSQEGRRLQDKWSLTEHHAVSHVKSLFEGTLRPPGDDNVNHDSLGWSLALRLASSAGHEYGSDGNTTLSLCVRPQTDAPTDGNHHISAVSHCHSEWNQRRYIPWKHGRVPQTLIKKRKKSVFNVSCSKMSTEISRFTAGLNQWLEKPLL